MKSFLKMLLASIIGGALLIFIIFIIFASLISLSAPELEVPNNTILRIDLNTAIVDRAQKNPFSSFDPVSGEPEVALGLNKAIAALKAAKDDEKILGVYLKGGIPMGDAAAVTELRNALLDFKSSGKFIYGYSEILTQKGLYIATAADSFFMNPEGFIEWAGLSASVTYYKEGLEKLGLEPVVFRASGNKFKSAVEPLLRQEMSEENTTQLNEIIHSVWNTYLEDVSAATGLTIGQLNALADSFAISGPEDAVSNGLIAASAYKDEIDSLLAKKSGSSIANTNFLTIQKYGEDKGLNSTEDFAENKVALIIAQGGIQSGEGSEYTIGSERIAKAIRKARKNEDVKAIVLRVNSPGGSALASEVIWREVMLAADEKPFIASLGGVAASGGYYIAAFADTIIAQPNTITGSIGAFGVFFTAEELLNDKLGINIETVTTNRYADLGTPDRKITPAEKAIFERQVDQVYQTFLQRVAKGRKLKTSYVDSIGGGRVYTGKRALELGLVDMLGGLDTAITIAAGKAGLEEYRVVEYPELKDPIQQIIEDLSGGYQARILKQELGTYARYLEVLKEAQSLEGMQTRLPYDIDIE